MQLGCPSSRTEARVLPPALSIGHVTSGSNRCCRELNKHDEASSGKREKKTFSLFAGCRAGRDVLETRISPTPPAAGVELSARGAELPALAPPAGGRQLPGGDGGPGTGPHEGGRRLHPAYCVSLLEESPRVRPGDQGEAGSRRL